MGHGFSGMHGTELLPAASIFRIIWIELDCLLKLALRLIWLPGSASSLHEEVAFARNLDEIWPPPKMVYPQRKTGGRHPVNHLKLG